MYMYILLSTRTHTILTYKFYNMPSHNVYYASVHRDNWCDWKGEDSTTVLCLCTKFTVVTIHVYWTKILVVQYYTILSFI